MSKGTVQIAFVSKASGQQLGVKMVTRTRHVAMPARVSVQSAQTVTVRPVG